MSRYLHILNHFIKEDIADDLLGNVTRNESLIDFETQLSKIINLQVLKIVFARMRSERLDRLIELRNIDSEFTFFGNCYYGDKVQMVQV